MDKIKDNIRSKPQDYNVIRKKILEFCVEPKTLSELVVLLGVDKNIPYRAIQHLVDGHCLKPENDRKVNNKRYKTISFDYTPPPVKSNYKAKEIHTPSPGGKIYTLDKPFKRDEDNYHTRHIEAQRQRDKERTRARTYVGISQVYND